MWMFKRQVLQVLRLLKTNQNSPRVKSEDSHSFSCIYIVSQGSSEIYSSLQRSCESLRLDTLTGVTQVTKVTKTMSPVWYDSSAFTKHIVEVFNQSSCKSNNSVYHISYPTYYNFFTSCAFFHKKSAYKHQKYWRNKQNSLKSHVKVTPLSNKVSLHWHK